MPVQWLDCPVHAGVFSYDSDRQETPRPPQLNVILPLSRVHPESWSAFVEHFCAKMTKDWSIGNL